MQHINDRGMLTRACGTLFLSLSEKREALRTAKEAARKRLRQIVDATAPIIAEIGRAR